jgi:hypothetical protein
MQAADEAAQVLPDQVSAEQLLDFPGRRQPRP